MPDSIRRFMLDESGLESVEWAVVGGLVVAVGASVFALIGADVLVGITNLSDATGMIP